VTATALRPPLRRRIAAASATTPGRFRLASVAIAAALVLSAIAATVAAGEAHDAMTTAESSSGPILVATQQLVSSVAEADAAATAAFLSGKDEDPEQRRGYEQALARADQQLEEIAALAGAGDSTHDVLKDLSVELTSYAGIVEAARAANRGGLDVAPTYLTQAVAKANAIIQDQAAAITRAAQQDLARDRARRTRGAVLALGLIAVALLLLVGGQVVLALQTRRLLNLPLVVATVLVVAAGGWLVLAQARSGRDRRTAETRGYASMVVTARLQTAAFGAKADETLALVTGDASHLADADAAATTVSSGVTPAVADSIRQGSGLAAVDGLIGDAARAADSARERAAVAEMATRWQRYRDTSGALRTASTPAVARTVATGAGNTAFNGFNFSVEAVVGQNRAQFLSGVAEAASATRRPPRAVPLLLLLAVLATLAGYQLRIGDYR
jgi:hypothetical protein